MTVNKTKHKQQWVMESLHRMYTYYRASESTTTGPKGLVLIKYIDCPHISWKAEDLPFIAKVSLSQCETA